VIELDAANPQLAGIVRAGDMVMWGQAAAEPVPLTRALMAQRAAIGNLRAFVGITWSDAVQVAHADHVSFLAYGAGGNNRLLAKAGCLDILPAHYSQLPGLIERGVLKVDVLMLQVAPPDASGRYSMSLAVEYLLPAIRTARVVIAEVNAQAPRTGGPHALTAADIDYVVHTDRPPLAAPVGKPHPAEAAVARHVASLIEDGATLQYGIGSLPEAIVGQLADRRELGVHSGAIGDATAALMRAGVITNARKTIDAGITIAGTLMGSSLLNGLAHDNTALELRGVEYTHSLRVLASIDRLVAINSAVEVDLTGQVNAEVANGIYVGAVGGAIDFTRGAMASRGGVPIVALTSRTDGKQISRIVASLHGPVSTARSDAAVIVTEHGISDLRGLSLAQRVPRMIAIAHPDEREALERAARELRLT
jgi:acyl-CoA hydrolase